MPWDVVDAFVRPHLAIYLLGCVTKEIWPPQAGAKITALWLHIIALLRWSCFNWLPELIAWPEVFADPTQPIRGFVSQGKSVELCEVFVHCLLVDVKLSCHRVCFLVPAWFWFYCVLRKIQLQTEAKMLNTVKWLDGYHGHQSLKEGRVRGSLIISLCALFLFTHPHRWYCQRSTEKLSHRHCIALAFWGPLWQHRAVIYIRQTRTLEMDGRIVEPWQQRSYLEKQKAGFFFWKWKEINDASMAQLWQIAMSIMMCIDYLSTPLLPVTCPFPHPSFLQNDSIHISVTVMRLYLLFRKWKSSIWPLYLTSGLVLCCGGLETALASFNATLSSYKDILQGFHMGICMIFFLACSHIS